MKIYTLHIGQGQFVVVTSATEAVIIDTYVPLSGGVINVKGALAKILPNLRFIGLIVTGFDSDHFNEVGMKLVLNKYRPDWIMYPKYFKKTAVADSCFAALREFDASKPIPHHSILLQQNTHRFYEGLSNDFTFEVFSPNAGDMNSSNNCSIVCKIVEKSTRASYLVTGDTENDRWSGIISAFPQALSADVMAAPHHGSKNGTTAALLQAVRPNTVIVSAGVDSQYGHPSPEAIALYRAHVKAFWLTNSGKGQSLLTEVARPGVVNTTLFAA